VIRVLVTGPSDAPGEDQRRLAALARETGVQLRHLRPSLPTLEDVFARVVGEP
jgi:hypothetical protein